MFLLGGLLAVPLLVAFYVLLDEAAGRLSGPITGRIGAGLLGLAMVGVGLNLFVYSTGRSTPLTGTTGPVAPSKVRAVLAFVFVLVGLAVVLWAVVAQDTTGGF